MELNEVFKKADIVDYISQYIDLEFKNGEYWGLSLFKDESTPSFSVNRDKRCFKDFASGVGGNIVDFIKIYHKCETKEAFDILNKYLGTENKFVAVPETLKIMRNFKERDDESKKTRKILSKNDINKYKEQRIPEWEAEGISFESVKKHNIRIDTYNRRIMMPIYDNEGKFINFLGRTYEKDWKALGLPKYIYKEKLGVLDFFWGLNENKEFILEKKQVIVVEGIKSVLKLESWGYKNVCAMLTSHMDQQQYEILLSLGVDIVLALDEDVDVMETISIAERNKDKKKRNFFSLLSRFLDVYYIKNINNVLGSKDSPCDKGKDVWEMLFDKKERIRVNWL